MLLVNGKRFDDEYFLNRETIYKKIELHKVNTIKLHWEDNRDIVHLMMAAQYLRDCDPYAYIVLEIPYVPYSAMDREIGDQINSCKYIVNIINIIGFDRVQILDPHSETVKNLNYLTYFDLQSIVDQVVEDVKPDFIYYPDKGAYAKYPQILRFEDGIRVFNGLKHRDLANRGHLSPEMKIELHDISPEELKGKRVLIIDDICRKGGTAYYAALNLKELGVAEVYLYISHCEDCIEQGELLTTDVVKGIYTTDSEYKILDVAAKFDKIHVINI